MKLYLPSCLLSFALVGMLLAQETGSPTSTPVSYASMTDVNSVLGQLNASTQALSTDLPKLHVEKWKADGDSKRQSLANVESIQRNLQNALPGMVSQVSASPESLALTFKLYRNVGALYDVLSNLAESAGAFGSKDEFQTLANDSNGIDKARRALADRMDRLAAAKDSELASLHTQVKTLQAAIPPPPPTKIVVDDIPKPKKPVKKRSAKPAGATAAPGTATPTPPKS